ncbi:MAG TPA: DNA polymerase III subunit epsilon [Stellaceae bacterium]|nr:DNA polymerase III subunit epsilon [Stellaceae bacterium]
MLDTETTGLDPAEGHRIVEIAALELLNHVPTGRVFHAYVNPERAMPSEAEAIHGLSDAFLAKEKTFAAIVDAFLAFIGADRLVIHNAEFDQRFINAELKRLQRAPLASPVTDTLALARSRFPGAPASLDALCRRFEIDLTARTKHGARLDCELLAQVYLELIGGRQPGLELAHAARPTEAGAVTIDRPARPPRPHAPTAEEMAAHEVLIAKLTDTLWRH